MTPNGPGTAQVLTALQASFRRHIPSGQTIVHRAVQNALEGHETDTLWIKTNFSELVEAIQVGAYQEYLVAEQEAGSEALRDVFLELPAQNATPAAVLQVVGDHFQALDKFFLGLTQGRRARAGKAFEFVIKDLIGRLGYPFTPQAVINGQPDFLMPSEEHFRRHAMDAIILTAKRTLRERWRQIVTEGTRGLGFFLATIDEKIASRDLEEMNRARIYIVVPSRVKGVRADYERAPNVISFEHFFQYYLDPAMQRWRDSGII
jgi:hypothetical protein